MKLLTTGGTMMELISEHTKKENYMLDHTNKKAYKLPDDSKSDITNPDAKPKVTKTSETETIAGYKCTKYIIEEPNSKSVQQVWTTKDIKIPVGAFSNSFGNKSSKVMMIEGVEGLPLKMIVNEHGTTSEVVATEITKDKVNEADLKVPSGYAIEPFDPAIIGRMMMGR
jgi:preprotein translocase subunit Sec63